MKNEIVKLDAVELSAIEPSKAEMIKKTFEPMTKMLAEFEEDYVSIVNEASTGITKDTISKAKRLRLDIGQVRIKTGKLKDQQKEYIKLEDKAIMGVHNILVWAVKEKEDKLKNIETTFEREEEERLSKLQADRAELLSKYVDDAFDRDLKKFEDDEFDALLQMKKKAYTDNIEAIAKAESERIEKEKAEQIERERIQKENEALRKQAEEREKKAKVEAAERLKIENARVAKEKADQDKRDAIALAEKEKNEKALRLAKEKQKDIERKAKAESDALKAKIEAKEKADRIALEKIEADKKAEQLAKEQALQAELNKGDAEKVKDLISDLTELTNKYTFKSEKNKKKYLGVCELIIKVITYINK